MIHILVVDDDPELNRAVCTYLNDSGFTATGCLGGNDACQEMYNKHYDLIISDIMMPGVDGFEFARAVRRVNGHIPILFMSARDDMPAKRRGFQLGIDDYMVKPIELDELLMRVRALLQPHRTARSGLKTSCSCACARCCAGPTSRPRTS